jgi:oxaloacetate decarboxylase alpha subunit
MKVFEHQVPGGMISNLVSQLEEQKALDKLEEVLEEIPRVREDLGYPPLVTPTSQIVGIQAVINVLMQERYKMCPGEVKDYVRGFYGRPPVPIKEEIRKKIIGDEQVITVRPADLLNPGWEKAKEEVKGLVEKEEDILTYALFPQVALKFFEFRQKEGQEIPRTAVQPKKEEPKPLSVSQPKATQPKPRQTKEVEKMNVDQLKEIIQLLEETSIAELELEASDFKLSLRKALAERPQKREGAEKQSEAKTKAVLAEAAEEDLELIPVVSPMVGTFYRSPAPDAPPFVEKGSFVEVGQTLCIVEAMKLMNEIKSEIRGRIADILVENGQPVEYGQTMFLIAKE